VQQFLPVEAAGTGIEDAPLVTARLSRAVADKIAAFLDQKGFVTADQINGKALLG